MEEVRTFKGVSFTTSESRSCYSQQRLYIAYLIKKVLFSHGYVERGIDPPTNGSTLEAKAIYQQVE